MRSVEHSFQKDDHPGHRPQGKAQRSLQKTPKVAVVGTVDDTLVLVASQALTFFTFAAGGYTPHSLRDFCGSPRPRLTLHISNDPRAHTLTGLPTTTPLKMARLPFVPPCPGPRVTCKAQGPFRPSVLQLRHYRVKPRWS